MSTLASRDVVARTQRCLGTATSETIDMLCSSDKLHLRPFTTRATLWFDPWERVLFLAVGYVRKAIVIRLMLGPVYYFDRKSCELVSNVGRFGSGNLRRLPKL